MAYKIEISEWQRGHILTALREWADSVGHLSCIPHTGDPTGKGSLSTEVEEFDMLVKMFDELPEEEAGSPNCLHGFCL